MGGTGVIGEMAETAQVRDGDSEALATLHRVSGTTPSAASRRRSSST